jgi:hypothetical protein
MIKVWGGSGPTMRPTLIMKPEGFVGPFYNPSNPAMVTIGCEQSLVFSDSDFGPFDMSSEEKRKKENDSLQEIPPSKRKATKLKKKELVEMLMATDLGRGLGMQSLLNMRLKDIQEKATALSIDIERVATTKISTGWKGKSKGMLQVLWERGFIDESKLKQYKVKVLDDTGTIIPELSLGHMIENCYDFQNEVSQLEHVCHQIGAQALITTKYHAEFAGEGIEYSWGFCKSLYRRSPLKSKKGKENFDRLVLRCISRDIMKKELIRKFSKRARQYMLCYRSLEMSNEENPVNSNQDAISKHKIERMKSVLKSHRAAIDFDTNFVMTAVSAVDFDWDKEIVLGQKAMKNNKLSDQNSRKRKVPCP